MRKIAALLCAGALILTSLTACGASSGATGAADFSESGKTAGNEETDALMASALAMLDGAEDMFTDRDLSGAYEEKESKKINLDDGGVTITEEGTYILSGNLTDSMIVVDAPDSAKIQLVLDGVTVSNNGDAAIYVKEADKVFLTLAEGSVNNLTNDGGYTSRDGNNIDGVIFSKSDLTINGSGSLDIVAEEGHGIVSKDDLKITGGTITVKAEKKALSGKDSVRVAAGTMRLTAGKDGIHSGNDEEEEKGFVYVQGGDIVIDECYEGIEGDSVYLCGGNIQVHAQDDGLNASERGGVILISGGEITIDAEGDGVDSNGSLFMTGGKLCVYGPVNSGNGAIDYESTAKITGGTLTAVGSSGMAMNFSEAENQGSILVKVSRCEAGCKVKLSDSEGKELISIAPEKTFDSVLISLPDLKQGETYTLTAGEEVYEVVLEQLLYGEGTGFGKQGRPGMERQETGQPGMERPEKGQPGMERPEKGESGMEWPEKGEPGMEQPEKGWPDMEWPEGSGTERPEA